jgi:hypothetical protein
MARQEHLEELYSGIDPRKGQDPYAAMAEQVIRT